MRILVIDDHALVRDGISAMVRAIRADATVAEADSCRGGIEAARQGPWDVVFLDLNLPDQPGFVALEQFRRLYPESPVVVISGQEDRQTVLRALDGGAKAFLPKSANIGRMRAALTEILAGRPYLPDSVLLEPGTSPAAKEAPPIDLSPREREVLGLLLAGLPNKLIARRLDIAESTVKIHVSAILRSLKVTSRTQAIIEVTKRGITL
jgi:DNA-binding NarL/FixJ family response regulator